jgi:nucleotide-binding universal stress UspA family protein
MRRQIVVPLDGTAYSESILPHACMLAKAMQTGLTFLTILPPPIPIASYVPLVDNINDHAKVQSYLDGLANRLNTYNIEISTYVLDGMPADRILAHARCHNDIVLIAMVTHARSAVARWIAGNIPEQVIPGVRVPVLLTHPTTYDQSLAPRMPYQTIALLVEGNRVANTALDEALTLALMTKANLVLLIKETPSQQHQPGRHDCSLASAIRQAESDGISVREHIISDTSPGSLISALHETGADAVVVEIGTHKDNSRQWRNTIGSISHNGIPIVLAHSGFPTVQC